MKKILLMAVSAVMATSVFAQGTVKKVYLYKGNTVVVAQNYDDIDSIVFVDFIIPETPENSNFQARAFTVNSEGKQVYFSQGNLQYQATTNTWRFAENQYDMVGEDNQYISSTYEGWIDLFCWGTSGYDNTANDPFAVNYQPWSSSNEQMPNQIYTIKGEIESINCEMQQITGKCDTTWVGGGTYGSGDANPYGYGPSTFMTDVNLTGTSANYDWGVYNAISNGGNAAGQWRTLTYDEWYYILDERPLAQYLRSQATVCGIHGYVLLPDDFTMQGGLSWSYQTNNWETNTYDAQSWSAMEAIGAVFLPAAGVRYLGTIVNGVGSDGNYWSASYAGQGCAMNVLFYLSGAGRFGDASYLGYSVRLVQDVE